MIYHWPYSKESNPKDNKRLHITSTNFDEPRCVELVQESDTVIAIHGEGSAELSVFLGGRDDDLCKKLKEVLGRRGYAVKAHGNPDLQGVAARKYLQPWSTQRRRPA